MKIVHRFRIMIDVFVFDVCLIRAKIGLKMMLFARMNVINMPFMPRTIGSTLR